jgi:hypothetical protein
MFEHLPSHGNELALNSVGHMGIGNVRPQVDAFYDFTVTFAV